jgi:hypothetical protein
VYGKKKTKQNKTNHKQTNETWNNKLELYLLFLQLFFTFPFVLFSSLLTIHFFFPLSLMFFHIYPSSFAARAQLTLFFWANSAKAILHFRELLSPTFSVLTPTHLIPSLPYSSSMFFLLYVYIFHSSTFFFFRWPTFVFLISSLFAIDILSDRCQPTIGASIRTSLF